ncbi:uncharacterized protein LOC127875012 isoform X2 [Dreissena polymorpha]|uniref:uncharacterized protein LOC127875012 isoform X2 n=1 Tax=Dreissena polymorpha TaxID=45954 RepID=UPI00226480A9|nr:uncharacterized protein LOC127875012 isoform X2 [Dreissena polymorpha]
MAISMLQTFLILAVGIHEVTAGEWCFVQKSFDFGTDYKYCSWGCCTYNYGKQCCEQTYVSNIGVLVGSIVGGVIGLIVLVSILVACCCIMKRQRARQEQVFTTANIQPVYGAPGTQMAYAQQPYQPYPIQTTNMQPGYMSAPTQPMQSWQPPPYEEVNKGLNP